MASRGEIAPQKLQEERHAPGRAGGKCKTTCITLCFAFLAMASDRSVCAIFFSSHTDTEVAAATEDGLGCCGNILAVVSFIMIIMFFPFSLLVSIKVSKS